jgi:signal transduction histidine kinase
MSSISPLAVTQRESAVPAERNRPPRSIADALLSHGLLIVQCAALVLALMTAAQCHSVVTRTDPHAPKLPSVLFGVVLWYWWGVAATVIWKLAERSGKNFFSLTSTLKHAAVAVVLAGMHLWLLQNTIQWLMALSPSLRSAGYGSLDYLDLNSFRFEVLLYGFVFGLTGVIHLQLAAQRDAMRALSLEKQLSVAHLRALQMQLEPHFLFNTLNAISALVESARNQEAMRTIQHLNSILKSTLRRKTPEKVPLSEELELVDDYLSIEEIRFADRLEVKMTVEPGALDGGVPCFVLQPIIENAIRHGISRCEENGVIQIKADRRGSRLHLNVRDSGPGMDGKSEAGHGIGLDNTRERLAHFYGADFEFQIGTPDSGGCEVSIDIPYERCG